MPRGTLHSRSIIYQCFITHFPNNVIQKSVELLTSQELTCEPTESDLKKVLLHHSFRPPVKKALDLQTGITLND